MTDKALGAKVGLAVGLATIAAGDGTVVGERDVGG
jgi:hypothetical protein